MHGSACSDRIMACPALMVTITSDGTSCRTSHEAIACLACVPLVRDKQPACAPLTGGDMNQQAKSLRLLAKTIRENLSSRCHVPMGSRIDGAGRNAVNQTTNKGDVTMSKTQAWVWDQAERHNVPFSHVPGVIGGARLAVVRIRRQMRYGNDPGVRTLGDSFFLHAMIRVRRVGCYAEHGTVAYSRYVSRYVC